MEMIDESLSLMAARRPNSREYYYLKLLELGADDAMTVDRVAAILGLRPSSICRELAVGHIKFTPAISLEDLALLLFRNPGFSPRVKKAQMSRGGLSIEQLDYVAEIAGHICTAHPGLDEKQLSRALAVGLSRNLCEEWRASVELLAERLTAKLVG